jgi:alginate O-acetyltransferase complex protein AlgJ
MSVAGRTGRHQSTTQPSGVIVKQQQSAIEQASEHQPQAPSPRPKWGRGGIVVAILALAFFATPAVARIAGVRPLTIENHTLAPFPSLADRWEFFPKLATWATDHLPLRDRAVRVNSEISENAFGELPATAGQRPIVLMGKDGWLFYDADISNACKAMDHLAQVGDRVQRLGSIIAKATGSFTFVVAPDKSSVETDRLPRRYAQDACATAEKLALRKKLASTPPIGYVDLFGPIDDVKKQHGSAYQPQDTHWNDYGRIQYATVLTRHLDPALADGTSVVAIGPQSSPGDLNVLRGQPGPTTYDGASITRVGVTTQDSVQTIFGMPLEVTTSASTGAPLHPGRTVIIGDSFSHRSLPMLAPFFSEVDLVLPNEHGTPVEALAALLQSADTVIFEEIERAYVVSDSSLLEPHYMDRLEQLLSQPPHTG